MKCWSVMLRSMYSIYLCFAWFNQSLSMVDVVVWCVFSIIFCIKMVELRTFALTDIVWGNVYSIMSIKLHFFAAPKRKTSHKVPNITLQIFVGKSDYQLTKDSTRWLRLGMSWLTLGIVRHGTKWHGYDLICIRDRERHFRLLANSTTFNKISARVKFTGRHGKCIVTI